MSSLYKGGGGLPIYCSIPMLGTQGYSFWHVLYLLMYAFHSIMALLRVYFLRIVSVLRIMVREASLSIYIQNVIECPPIGGLSWDIQFI